MVESKAFVFQRKDSTSLFFYTNFPRKEKSLSK